MTTTEYLETIIEEARELLEYATVGGDGQYAFELMVHTGELDDCFNKLYDLGLRIRSELSDAA